MRSGRNPETHAREASRARSDSEFCSKLDGLLQEADEALKDVIEDAMRTSEIVRRERRLLRRAPLEMTRLCLNQMVHEMELFIRAEARHDEADVILELAPDLPTVIADPIQIQQVILNLARNGLQAMCEQPRATRRLIVRTASEGEEVMLMVIDAGPRVDGGLIARMFQPFYTTKPKGLGMGLPISKSIIAHHSGRIWASRNTGGGMSVSIALPRAEVKHVG